MLPLLNSYARREWERQATDWSLYGDGRWAVLSNDTPDGDSEPSVYFKAFDVRPAPLVALFSDYRPSPEVFLAYDCHSPKALASVFGVPEGASSLEETLQGKDSIIWGELVNNLKLYVSPQINAALQNDSDVFKGVIPHYITGKLINNRVVLSGQQARMLGNSGVFESTLVQRLVERNRELH